MSAEPRAPATRRILDAARALVARGGAAGISMGDVAIRAEVSKALVHYHFRDKDSLLRALVEDVGDTVIARSESALSAETNEHALDAFWAWLRAELEHGDVRTLVSLAEYDSQQVRDASREIAQRRRHVLEAHAARIFDKLGLAPRVPPALIAQTLLAFTDGLAVSQALEPDRDPRPAFDVLWLALLTLAD